MPTIAIYIALASLPGQSPGARHPRFVDVTQAAGISFVHTSGGAEKDYIFEVNGSGVALFDADGDGDLDVYFVNGARLSPPAGEPPPRDALYRNDGAWRFTDVTTAAGVGDPGWGCGVAVADVENDGDLDLYVTNWGTSSLSLNRGDGTFARAEASGLENPGMSTSASFGDFDADGLVDLFVSSYVELDPATARRRGDSGCTYKGVPIFCGPGGFQPARCRFFINKGGGRFEDASAAWGVRDAPPSYSLGTLALDVNRDGFLDLIVANDTQRNFCFLNDRGRRFQEAGVYLGLAYNDYGIAQAGMGLASGDLRGLGRDDVFVTNFEDDTNTLYLAEGRGLYSEGTYPAGLGSDSYPYLGWGTFFFDAENDGDLDVFVANGHVAPQADQMRSSVGYRQKNHLYLNDGSGKMSLCGGCGPGLELKKSSRGAAFGDLDGDGDPDIVVNAMDEPPTVLENVTPEEFAWLEVRLHGTRSNRFGIGARVTIEAAGKRQERTIQSGMSYASQCELSARFGLGAAQKLDRILVEWPSGVKETFATPRGVRCVLTLLEGAGEPLESRR